MARVLGAVRQSKTRDRAVSPEVQRKDITRYAENNEHTLVEITEDLSRSGKVSAFKRPHLGPWLTEPAKIAKWDVLVTTKLDRACRDAWDFLQLRKWCEENGKVYVSLSENIDLSTASGRLTATQWAATAEFERERMRERRLETLAELEEQGRWKGGRIGYGLRAVQTEDGYYLEPDEGGTADVVRKMGADVVIAVHLQISKASAKEIVSAFSVLGRSVELVIAETELRGMAGSCLGLEFLQLSDFVRPRCLPRDSL